MGKRKSNELQLIHARYQLKQRKISTNSENSSAYLDYNFKRRSTPVWNFKVWAGKKTTKNGSKEFEIFVSWKNNSVLYKLDLVRFCKGVNS